MEQGPNPTYPLRVGEMPLVRKGDVVGLELKCMIKKQPHDHLHMNMERLEFL